MKVTGSSRAASWRPAKASRTRWRAAHEELGIEVTASHRWHTLEHDYPHAYVRLYFCKVTGWTGEPHSKEGQAFVWQQLPVEVAPLLPAALPVLELLEKEAASQ